MVGVVYGPLLVGLVFTMMDIYKLFYQGSYSHDSAPSLGSDMTPIGVRGKLDPAVNGDLFAAFKSPRVVKKALSATLPPM
jgi:hypothetical protein